MEQRKTYKEKMLDPRWQKKRLEIMQRDNFTCQSCTSTTETLNVHHIRYFKGEPWEVEDRFLVTLCNNCHQEEHRNGDAAASALITVLREKFLAADLWDLTEGFTALEMRHPRYVIATTLKNLLSNPTLFDETMKKALLNSDNNKQL